MHVVKMSFIRAHLFPENIGPKIIWEDDRDIDVINIYIYKSFKSTTKPLKPVKQSRTWICPAVFRGELGKIFATFKQSMTFVFFLLFCGDLDTQRDSQQDLNVPPPFFRFYSSWSVTFIRTNHDRGRALPWADLQIRMSADELLWFDW